MKRTARVARTAQELDHVNRLRFPSFRVVELLLKAGSKASKSYLPPGSPPPAVAGTGTDDFHFLPEKETIEIHYEIEDKLAMADGGKLELYNRFEEDPLWSMDLKVLGTDWLSHGKHVVKWDGRVTKPTAEQAATLESDVLKHDLTAITADKTVHASFPDGYITLEHPPYKLRLVLTTEADEELKKRPAMAWTYFQILMKGMEFVLGDAETVPATVVDDDRHKLDKAVREKVSTDGGVPGDGATRDVFLISNLYKTSSAQMNDNTGFTVYETRWGDGPNIPLLAKIRMLDSADAEVKLDESDKGAVVLGKTRFLWDWEDPDEDVDTQQSEAKPKAFIKNAINFDKATTGPKGDNCHKDRGGKRGPSAKPVFPPQAGYDPKDTLDAGKFPFKVYSGDGSEDLRPKVRKWASCSEGWTKGKLKGHTGVVFQPSRMAGDDYKVTCYLAYDRKEKDKLLLDADTQPLVAADALKKTTGTWRIKREIHLARYVRKKSTMAAFLPGNLGAVQANYTEAYVQLENKMTAGDQYTLDDHELAGAVAMDYNQICEDLLTGSANTLYTDELAVEVGADHASVDSAFLVRNYADFVKAVHLHLDGAGGGDWTGNPTPEGLGAAVLPTTASLPLPDQPRMARLRATKVWLTTNGVATPKTYVAKLDDQLCTFIETQMVTRLQLISGGKTGVNTAAQAGITVVHFNYTNTYQRDLLAVGTAGIGSINGSAVDPTDASQSKCAFLYLNPRVDTFVHEIGHHLFMPHAPTAGGYRADRHDDSDTGCVMSYNRPRPAFCGLCQLRLRGWSTAALNKTSASNKRP